GGLWAARTVLAEGRERGVDQPRIDRRQRVVAQAQRVERARPVVLHEHVGGGDELFEDVAIRLRLEVEGDRALVGSLRQEGGARVAAVGRLGGAGPAALVGLVGVLALDHVGAEHSKLIGCERSRQHMRDVDHPDALERSRHRGLLAGGVASHAPRELRENWVGWYSRFTRSSIFRPLDKLVDRSFRRIRPVHDLQANDAFCRVAFALGKPRMGHRIKCSAVGTKEGLALGNWPCERHGSASVDTGLLCASNDTNSSGRRRNGAGAKPRGRARAHPTNSRISLMLDRATEYRPKTLTSRFSPPGLRFPRRSRSWWRCAGGRPSAWRRARADRTGRARGRRYG